MAKKVCPVWVGYFLASPLRKLFVNPNKVLSPFIEKDMKVLDVGCAMGFFSLPLAQLVGSKGKVICVDIQEKMIRALKKRARKAGLLDRIEVRICSHNSLGLDDFKDEVDFALASAVVHEVPDVSRFFREIHGLMKSTAKFLVIEPKGHVSKNDFETTVATAEENDFKIIKSPRISRSYTALLGKR